ncbi:MAG: hypothetical protein JRN68_11195 [Nitrososphaerota archaeon]|nr:hypothetical protein [Candidatus Sysuiplasma acidicola]MDG6935242.1 hypothetical protein [Nitrososphaerota archaeon]
MGKQRQKVEIGGNLLPAFKPEYNNFFKEDLKAFTKDRIFLERVRRRIFKVLENPEHHGVHAGGKIRCRWLAGVGNFYIVYSIHKESSIVCFLRFLDIDDV